MKKSRFFKLFILVSILAVAVVFIGMNFAQAQSQTKGKPPDKGKPKPPDLEYECNYNGNCEWEDYQAGSCPDCDPKTYPPLVLDQQPQIVAPSFNRIFQYKYDFGDGKFHDTWASNQFYEEEKIKGKKKIIKQLVSKSVCIGDVDNDGEKEIVALAKYWAGTTEKRVDQYNHKILIFENSSDGIPSWESPYFGLIQPPIGRRDCVIADADNDGNNEIVIAMSKHVEIKRIIYDEGTGTYDFSSVWESYDYDNIIWGIEVGDADNDTKNEIVLAAFGWIGAPVIWELNEYGIWVETIGEPLSVGAIDVAEVRDVDNDTLNEIVAGGNNNKLMIWKYVNGVYESVFVSGDLGGFTQGVDAGDIDSDLQNEIVVASSGDYDALYVFKYIDGNYQLVNSRLQDGGNIGISVGDLDFDGRGEIVSSTHGITIYRLDDDSGELVIIYNCYYGSYHEID